MGKVRRPTLFEINKAINNALLHEVFSDNIDPCYEQVQSYLRGPFRGAFLESLKLNVKPCEQVIVDKTNGLLIKVSESDVEC